MGDFTFGWDYGTHFFLVCLIPLILASEIMSKKVKLILCSLCAIIYFMMFQIIINLTPLHIVNHDIENIMGDVNLFVAFGLLGFVMIRYSAAVIENEHKLEQLNNKMSQMASTDQLTGIPNRRYIYRMIESESDEYNLSHKRFVIGMVDIDDFKIVNDTYGHLIGDRVLIEVVNRIQLELRKHDVVGRWGGEEFMIILPQTNLKSGRKVFERIQKTLADKIIDCGKFQIPVTITIGIAEYNPTLPFDELISQADECLYFGKRNGKNCVIGINSITK